ncbi:hypothetical protein LEMLEM_LOCUS8852 [Lemmus lemmus]
MFGVNMIQSPLEEMDSGSEGCFWLTLTLAFSGEKQKRNKTCVP